MDPLNSSWKRILQIPRWAGSALCFQVFFWGGLLLATLVIPAMRLRARDPMELRRRVLALISKSFRAFLQLMVRTRMLDRFDVAGSHWRERPCLVIANHPTLIDIVALFACLPRAGCVVKGSLLRHPFFGGVVRAAGYIPNDDAVAMLALARAHFEAGLSLVVFPEGSRSLPDGLRRFQRGAAHIALECDVPVVPVHVVSRPGFLRKGDRWHAIPEHPVEFRLEFHEPMEIPAAIRHDPIHSHQVRQLTDLFQARIETISGQRVVPDPTSTASP